MFEETFYIKRLLARILDALLVGLVFKTLHLLFPQSAVNPAILFLLYNVVVILMQGRTAGKRLFVLRVTFPDRSTVGSVRLLVRELLMLALFPVLVLNVLCSSSLLLHDRITGTRVLRDDN